MSNNQLRRLPDSFMGKITADEHISLFEQKKKPLLSKAMGNEETKAVWYKFKQFEDIYKELVYLDADGVRFYFGVYPDSDGPEYAGRLGLVLVPTRAGNDEGSHIDIILEEEQDFVRRAGSQAFIDGTGSKAYNYGSPCPPVCPPPDDIKYPIKK